MPLNSFNPSVPLEIWNIDFVGFFHKRSKHMGARYIITAVEYLTEWVEQELVKLYRKEVATRFIYKNIITRFRCSLTLISDQATHFSNGTIKVLMDQFLIDHRKTSLYHPPENEVVDSFNKNLHKEITKMFHVDKDVWDDKVPTVL
jgi:hypothetical protein